MKSRILFTLVVAASLAPVALRAEEAGSGAKLGDFEGRTTGVGPVLSYATKIGRDKKTDLVVEVKWLSELEVRSRLNGDIV